MSLVRFSIPHLLVVLCAVCLYAGAWWPWAFFLCLSILVTVGDRICPQDRAELQGINPRAANALLFAILPLLIGSGGVGNRQSCTQSTAAFTTACTR